MDYKKKDSIDELNYRKPNLQLSLFFKGFLKIENWPRG